MGHRIGLAPPLAPPCRAAHKHPTDLSAHRTGNLRALELLLGHTKIESTVGYLGIDISIEIAEKIDV